MATWHGTSNALTEQAAERVWSPTVGWQTIRSWEGPQALIAAKESELIQTAGVTEIRTKEGEPSLVRATIINADGGGMQYTDEDNAVWELIPVPVMRDIRQHPNIIRVYSASVAPHMEAIDKALAIGNATESDWSDATSNQYNAYAALRAMGTDQYRTGSWTIRKSWSSRKETDVQTLMTNTFRVVAYADIGVPAAAKWQQPMIHTYQVTQWTDVAVNQWLTLQPQVRWDGKRYNIVREWDGALKYSGTLYHGGEGEP